MNTFFVFVFVFVCCCFCLFFLVLFCLLFVVLLCLKKCIMKYYLGSLPPYFALCCCTPAEWCHHAL